jgi:glycosyltransferase involved in cell wall biosynthesis
MKIAYVTAGAAGMYCGSCMRDNTLVAALTAQGHDAVLVPIYTPIRTDEDDVSIHRVFFGGINVYLQQNYSLFRHTPRFLDRLLDAPGLLRWVSRFAVKTQAERLGDLTLSMLRGEHGHQRKEVDRLIDWLTETRPQIVNITNIMLSGIVGELRRRIDVPLLCSLQGDDIYLDFLPDNHRGKAMDLIRQNSAAIDGYITTSNYYADFMTDYLGLARERIHVVLPGLNLKGHGGPRPERNGEPFTIGYFARICPEKGFHVLAEAFHLLRQSPGVPPVRLRISGYLGAQNQPWFDGLLAQLRERGHGDVVEHVESPDHDSKVRFLQALDVLSVPTTYREPKGLYVLEALANGVPVVQPRHGSFPELLEATGGGLLVNPNDPADLATTLRRLVDDSSVARELGRKGREAVHSRFTADRMAADTTEVYRRYVRRG